MIRSKQARSIVLTTLLVLSAVWSAGALIGGVAAADSSTDADNDTRANASVVDAPKTVNGTVNTSDDADWFRVNLDSDQMLFAKVGIRTTDQLSEEDIPPTMNVSIYDEDGQLVASGQTQPEGYNPFRTVQGLENGTYYVRVTATAVPDEEAHTGETPYTLALKTTAADQTELDGNATDATELADGETVSAVIDLNDYDRFTFHAEEGERVTVTVTQTGGINVDDRPGDVGHNIKVPGDGPSPLPPSDGDDGVNHVGNESTVTFTANTTGTYAFNVYQPHHGFLVQPAEVTLYDVSLTIDSGEDSAESGGDDADDGENTGDGERGDDDSGTDEGTDDKADSDAPDVDDGC